MLYYLIEQWATEAFVPIDRREFRPFFIRLMLDLEALGCNTLLKNLSGSSCRKIATQRHRDPSGQYLTQDNHQEPCGCHFAHSHDEYQGRDQAIIEPKDHLA